MQTKARLDEGHILELLSEMSQIAKSAKRIEEIIEAMNTIATQTTLMALDATILQQRSGRGQGALTGIGNSVKDATEEMYHQFNLLLDEVSELDRTMKAKKELQLKESNLN